MHRFGPGKIDGSRGVKEAIDVKLEISSLNRGGGLRHHQWPFLLPRRKGHWAIMAPKEYKYLDLLNSQLDRMKPVGTPTVQLLRFH